MWCRPWAGATAHSIRTSQSCRRLDPTAWAVQGAEAEASLGFHCILLVVATTGSVQVEGKRIDPTSHEECQHHIARRAWEMGLLMIPFLENTTCHWSFSVFCHYGKMMLTAYS